MRKLAALLTALALLLTAAWASGENDPDLYDLYKETEDGRVWAGNAVPVMDGVLIASPAGISSRPNRLEVWDGKVFREIGMALYTADRKVLVMLYDTEGETPAIPAFPFVEAGRVLQAGDVFVRSGDWMRSRLNRAVYDLVPVTWNGLDAMILTLSGDTAGGSVLLTSDGKLAGIIAAEYAEGMNRYVALTAAQISACIMEASRLLDSADIDENPPEGYIVTTDANLVTFDWSAVKLPEVPDGQKLYLVVADTESSYLTYMEVAEGATSATMLLTPGRMYVSGIAPYEGAPSDLPEQIALTALPEAEPYTDYGFRSEIFAIAETPKGTDMPVPAADITEELLRSGNACIYSVSSYQVTEMSDNYSLLIDLTAPDGSNFRYESAWYFDPAIMDRDEWYVTLPVSGLLDMLDSTGYPAGIYKMCMYIDGKLADSLIFTLK